MLNYIIYQVPMCKIGIAVFFRYRHCWVDPLPRVCTKTMYGKPPNALPLAIKHSKSLKIWCYDSLWYQLDLAYIVEINVSTNEEHRPDNVRLYIWDYPRVFETIIWKTSARQGFVGNMVHQNPFVLKIIFTTKISKMANRIRFPRVNNSCGIVGWIPQ
jgi:hypothetical protein